MVPIYSLPQEWLWCSAWCTMDSLAQAKTIDLCNNPLTKTPKLEVAKQLLPEWTGLDQRAKELEIKFAAADRAAAEKAAQQGQQTQSPHVHVHSQRSVDTKGKAATPPIPPRSAHKSVLLFSCSPHVSLCSLLRFQGARGSVAQNCRPRGGAPADSERALLHFDRRRPFVLLGGPDTAVRLVACSFRILMHAQSTVYFKFNFCEKLNMKLIFKYINQGDDKKGDGCVCVNSSETWSGLEPTKAEAKASDKLEGKSKVRSKEWACGRR